MNAFWTKIFGRRPDPIEELEGRTKKLANDINKLTKIMATQAEAAAELVAKAAQVRKAIDEIMKALDGLREQVRNSPVTPELQAAIDAVGAAAQTADDIVPDMPTP